MTISIRCPGCDKKLKAKDEHAGKRVKCPTCGRRFLVRAPSASAAAPKSEASPPAGTLPVSPWVLYSLWDVNESVRFRAVDEVVKNAARPDLDRFHSDWVCSRNRGRIEHDERETVALLRMIGPLAAEALAIATDADRISDSTREFITKALQELDGRPLDPAQRAWVAVALEKWKDVPALGAAAVRPLVAAMEWASEYHRKRAVEVLDQLRWRPADDHERAVRAVARQDWNEVTRLGATAVRPLVKVLRKYGAFDQKARAAAGQALQQIVSTLDPSRDPRALIHLVEVHNGLKKRCSDEATLRAHTAASEAVWNAVMVPYSAMAASAMADGHDDLPVPCPFAKARDLSESAEAGLLARAAMETLAHILPPAEVEPVAQQLMTEALRTYHYMDIPDHLKGVKTPLAFETLAAIAASDGDENKDRQAMAFRARDVLLQMLKAQSLMGASDAQVVRWLVRSKSVSELEKVLSERSEEISSSDLRAILRMDTPRSQVDRTEFSLSSGEFHQVEAGTEALDCSRVKQLAGKELARRGEPADLA